VGSPVDAESMQNDKTGIELTEHVESMRHEKTDIAFPETAGAPRFKIRLLAVSIEILLVAVLCILWFGVELIRNSHSLWVLFFYSFPSQFLIAVVPHEPVYFYFSKLYQPWTVTLVAVTGTLLTELVNYSVLNFFADLQPSKKILDRKLVRRLVALFTRAPFAALLVAGFSPVPFYPFRFLVVFAKYPVWKYTLAVLISRSARFYIFALVGHVIGIPDSWLMLLFFGITVLILAPVIREFIVKGIEKIRQTS
jgi:membrane protein YqaA with SNARE-associated domain